MDRTHSKFITDAILGTHQFNIMPVGDFVCPLHVRGAAVPVDLFRYLIRHIGLVGYLSSGIRKYGGIP